MSYQGYTCSICGAWVQYGTSHFCGGGVGQPQTNQTTVTIQPSLGELRMAAALERIAAALEKLAESPEQTA